MATYLFLIFFLQSITWAQEGERPNVLFIVLDATRADHLSCYGYERPTSPNFDALAREGILYENCISTASWTLPSFASMFTGKYVRDHGVSSQRIKLDSSEQTMAELFRQAGYATIGYSANAWLGSFSNMDQGFDEYYDMWRSTSSESDDGAAVTNEWIADWLDVAGEDRPFFMFVLYFEPHFPYAPPAPFAEKFLPAGARDEEVLRLRRWKHPREVGYILKAPGMEVNPAEFEILRSLYDAEIAYVDSRLGELINLFRERDLLDNTVVVVTADHGEHLGDHDLMDHKMSLYDAVIRVPLVVRYPTQFPPGKRIQEQVQTVNILPALLESAGISPELETSLFEPLPTSAGEGLDFTFSEFRRPDLFLDVMIESFPEADHQPFNRALKSVRSHQWKFIWASDGRHELYDLLADPGETENVLSSRPEIADRMTKILEEFEARERP